MFVVVKEYFIAYTKRLPQKKMELQRISLALRREGILTMADLCERLRAGPQQLTQIRNIGEKSILLIKEICMAYENKEIMIIQNEED